MMKASQKNLRCGVLNRQCIPWLRAEEGVLKITIGKGAGFRQKRVIDRLLFIFLGVRLHIRKILLSLLPLRKIRYLITFVSIPEGLRADQWLDSRGERRHIALPVPSDITAHCGVVLGFSERADAVKTY
jgi:hypothetical protein